MWQVRLSSSSKLEEHHFERRQNRIIWIFIFALLSLTTFGQQSENLTFSFEIGKTNYSFLDENGLNYGSLNAKPKLWIELLHIPKFRAKINRKRSGLSLSLERYYAWYPPGTDPERNPTDLIDAIIDRHFMLAQLSYQYDLLEFDRLTWSVSLGLGYRYNRRGQVGETWIAGYYSLSDPRWIEPYFGGRKFHDWGAVSGTALTVHLLPRLFTTISAEFGLYEARPKQQIGLSLTVGYTILGKTD